ncbi:MAG: dihydroorotase, partial [Gammaproteobacteria bacterium]|nr:dihydroorotase [Gammaproteobacteria bacterium]
MSLTIRGPAYIAGKVRPAAIRIEGGIIRSVSNNVPAGDGRMIELAPRQLILPAGVDLLCGLRDWIAAPKETVECATRGALAGGVTVVCDQANIVPRLNTVARIR